MKPLKAIGKFFLGLMLFIVSIALTAVGTPWGLIEFVIDKFYQKRFWKALAIFGELILVFAILVDISANIIMQVPFNRLLISSDGYQFGNRMDTISFVLGHNQEHDKLTQLGKGLCSVLDLFEEDHCKITYDNKMEYLKYHYKII